MRTPLLLLLSLAALGCGILGPAVGGTCDTTDISCDGPGAVFVCAGGTWVSVPCAGPAGCVTTSTSVTCDTTVARADTLCPPWLGGHAMCQVNPAAVLACADGTWKKTADCQTCAVSGTTAACTDAPRCGPATCAGCCTAAGDCLDAPANHVDSACGFSGAACEDCGAKGQVCGVGFVCAAPQPACGAATCSGCCANGQCVAAPDNSAGATCGKGGNACNDCSALGLVCDTTSFSCNTSQGGTGGGNGTDPCNGVPTGGQCLTSTVVRFCSVPTGSGAASVQSYACVSGATCQATGNGAACVGNGACKVGDARCNGTASLETCNASGGWSPSACATGCRGSAVGAYCPPATATVTLTAKLAMMAREPRRPSYSDWAAAAAQPARGVFVVVQDANKKWVDATTTDANGQYTVKVPAAPAAGDKVIFVAWGGDGLNVRFAVQDPQLASSSGGSAYAPGQTLANTRQWSWNSPISGLANGGTLTVTEAQGSAALNLFDMQQQVYAGNTTRHQGRAGQSIVIWWGPNVDWTCGGCFMDYPGNGFDSQIWLSGNGADLSYWSDAVVAHELGHWAMAAWGTSPGEGGTHYLATPTFPGQAWSEGWATFHSSFFRNDPIYFDRSSSGMFHVDLNARTYSDSTGAYYLPLSTPAGGLLQKMEENEVSSILWSISKTSSAAGQVIQNAVASPHLNVSPWPRNYHRHTWNVDANGTFTNEVDTGQATPCLPDFLDALRCSGVPATAVDTGTQPASHYPYASASPTCRTGFCYGCKSGSTCNPGNTTAACGSGGASCTACAAGQTCTMGVCQ